MMPYISLSRHLKVKAVIFLYSVGDYVSKLGCKQSTDDTIKYRMRKLTSKVNDMIMLADAPMMGADGSSTTTIKIFEAQGISGLLLNCKSWIGITDSQIAELQNFQDKFERKLLHLPIPTPKAILHLDGGMEMMKWRIAKSKLMFMRKIILKEDDNICRRALMNETIMEANGLSLLVIITLCLFFYSFFLPFSHLV